MPIIRKRRIWWEPVSEATSYVVYVTPEKTLFEKNNFMWDATPGIIFKVVMGKTEFPIEQGTYYIGITSRDDTGNQSDPFLSSGLFKLFPPPPPKKGGIENL
jgi:hypothetical protein